MLRGESASSRRDTSREMVLPAKHLKGSQQEVVEAQKEPEREVELAADMNEKQILAKSYSKFMRAIGDELRNVGPFGHHPKKGSNSPAKSRSGKKVLDRLNSDNNSPPTVSMNKTASSNNGGGLTALVGVPMNRVPPRTAVGGTRGGQG